MILTGGNPCLKSIVSSINSFDKAKETSMTIIDDHSSEETISRMKEVTLTCNGKVEFIHLEGTGNNDSLKKTYELAMGKGASLIYFVEDDHIHKETAIQYMVNAFENFSKKLPNGQVAIAPYDDPIDYISEIIPARIVASKDCHWRQNFHTTCTVLLTKWVLLHFWDKFTALSNYGINGINEDNTINLIYRSEEVFLFTPIPFQAFHLQDVPPVVGEYTSLLEANLDKIPHGDLTSQGDGV